MSQVIRTINNEFEAKAFESLLPEVFCIDAIRELYKPLTEEFYLADRVLSFTHFLFALNCKYNTIDNEDYDKVYKAVSKQASVSLFDFFNSIEEEESHMFEIWRRVLNILNKDNKFLESIIHNGIDPSSQFIFLLDKLDLSNRAREIISKKIESNISIFRSNDIMRFDNCPKDLQEAITEETKRQFFDRRDNYFFSLTS